MAQPFCSRCGTAQDPSNVFCPKCGQRLPGEETEAAAPEASPKAEPDAGEGTEPATPGTVADELWFRLRAEEQEYTRRSRRNGRIGCLVVLVILVGFVFAVWKWGPTGH
jgi:uncharacterized Zn finger protein (UPF0148 family)